MIKERMEVESLEALISVDEPLITALSNTAAFLYQSLDQINWCGFYLFDGEKLVLGPFGGKPACTVIPMGKGVCGTAAELQEIIVVRDVDEFPGHIACDAASKSEIVLPLILSDGRLFGVLDIDAPTKDRFSEDDKEELGNVAKLLVQKIDTMLHRTKRDYFFI